MTNDGGRASYKELIGAVNGLRAEILEELQLLRQMVSKNSEDISALKEIPNWVQALKDDADKTHHRFEDDIHNLSDDVWGKGGDDKGIKGKVQTLEDNQGKIAVAQGAFTTIAAIVAAVFGKRI